MAERRRSPSTAPTTTRLPGQQRDHPAQHLLTTQLGHHVIGEVGVVERVDAGRLELPPSQREYAAAAKAVNVRPVLISMTGPPSRANRESFVLTLLMPRIRTPSS